MNTRQKVAVLGYFVALGCLGACSGDGPVRPIEDPDVLVTVEFENYLSLERPREGFVFISDQDGHVLDCAPWTSTSKVVLRNTEVHPETVSLTIFENSDTRPAFSSEFAVPKGSVRKFPLWSYPVPSGMAMIHLRNAPNTLRYTMSANGFTYLGHVQPPRQVALDVIGDTTDLYAMVVPEVGPPVGGWLRGLRAGGRDTVDFDSARDVAPLKNITFQIPEGGGWVICNARTRVQNSLPSGKMMMDHVAIFDNVSDSLSLYLPTLDPTGVVLEFYQEFPGEPESFYWQEIHGQLPSEVTNLEGDLAVVSATPDSVVIAAAFAWDRFLTLWRQEKDYKVSWLVEGPRATEGQGLPSIPSEVAELIPGFAREGFTIRTLEVYQETSDGVVRSQGKKFRTDKMKREREPIPPSLRYRR